VDSLNNIIPVYFHTTYSLYPDPKRNEVMKVLLYRGIVENCIFIAL